ncbi:O-antigen polymerase [Candidatus Omnitrophota bacterium]
MKLISKEAIVLLFLILLTSAVSLSIANNPRVLFGSVVGALTILIVVPSVLKLSKRRLDIFEPVFFFSILFLFFHVIKSIDIYYFGSRIVTPKSLQSNIAAIGYALIGYLFFLGGYYMRLGRTIGRRIPVISKHDDHANATFVYVGMMIIGLVSLFILTHRGGFINYITYLNVRAKFFSQRGIYYYFLLFMPISFLLWYAFSFTKRSSFKNGLTVIFFLLSLCGTVCTGSRLNVVMLILGTLIIRHYMHKRVNFKFVSLIGIAMVILLVFGGYLRRQGLDPVEKVRLGVERDTISQNVFVNTFHLVARRFYPHEELILLIDNMPEKLDFQYGRSYLSAAFYFVPGGIMDRDLKKRLSMGRLFTSTFFPGVEEQGLTTFSPGILGEGYMNFHVFGVITGMFILGVFYRSLYAYLQSGVSDRQRVLIYAIVLPGMAKIVKGGFVSGIKLLLGFFVPLLIGIFLMERLKSKRCLPG